MLRSAELWAHFLSLTDPDPKTSALFSAKVIPGRDADYIAKGVRGEPIVLLRVTEPHMTRPPLRLRYISVEYAQECRVKEEGISPVVGEFVMVTCVPDNPALFELFVRSADALVSTIPTKPTVTQIEGCVRSFVELYRKLSQPSSRSIKGLWAELFLIDTSTAPIDLVSAWHVDATEKFDFSSGDTHIEVKASELPQRVHEFALGQLRPAPGSHAYLASMLLQRSAGGVGVLDLGERIAAKLGMNRQLISKVWDNIAQSLGSDFGVATDIKFDEHHAFSGLRMVPIEAIPCVQTPLAPEILDVRIKVDVSAIADMHRVSRERVEAMLTAS